MPENIVERDLTPITPDCAEFVLGALKTVTDELDKDVSRLIGTAPQLTDDLAAIERALFEASNLAGQRTMLEKVMGVLGLTNRA